MQRGNIYGKIFENLIKNDILPLLTNDITSLPIA